MRRANPESIDKQPTKRPRTDAYMPDLNHAIHDAFRQPTQDNLLNLLNILKKEAHLTPHLIESLLKEVTCYLKADNTALNDTLQALISLAAHALHFQNHDFAKQIHLAHFLIYNLGYLAKMGCDLPLIPAGLIRDIIEIQHASAKQSANILYGLGWLAKKDRLSDPLSSETVQILVTQLIQDTSINTQDISNSLYGLGLLAQASQLVEAISGIETLMQHFTQSKNINFLDIITSLYGLGLLVKTDKLKGTIPTEAIEGFLHALVTQYNNTMRHRDYEQCLSSVSMLAQAGHLRQFDPRSIQPLINNAMRGYLHPLRAATLINSILILSQYYPISTQALAKLIDAISLPITAFPPHLHQQLKNNLTFLQLRHPVHYHTLQAHLFPQPKKVTAPRPSLQPAPVQAPAQHKTQTTAPLIRRNTNTEPKNDIFKLINASDLQGLEKLLNTTLSFTSHSTGTHEKTTPLHLLGEKHRSHARRALTINDTRIAAFLKTTDTQALQDLIEKSNQHFFFLLIKACSIGQRFEMAQNHQLHPIILKLPLNELSKFITNLQNTGQMYRDHRATLSIIDALKIRAIREPQHQSAIKPLIEALLTRSLEFHDDSHHKHVVEHLYSFARQNILRVVDIDEENEHATSMAETTETTTPSQAPKKTGVNQLYQYDSEDINLILQKRIHEKQRDICQRLKLNTEVAVLGSMKLNGINIQGNVSNRPVDCLQLFFQENPNLQGKTVLLLPIEISHSHWVGLTLTIHNNKITSAHYYNSLQNDVQDLLIVSSLSDSFKNAGLLEHNGVQVISEPCLQQTDGSSCGPVMIENFYTKLTGTQWPQHPNLMETIRKRHLDLLQLRDQPKYDAFNRKQSGNANTVGSLSQQLSYHGLHAHPSIIGKTQDNRDHCATMAGPSKR